MTHKITKVVWTRQARESLKSILDYRYKEIPSARNIVYQEDEIYSQYRRIIVRDYKILYKESKSVAYILNVVCTKAAKEK